MSEPGRAPDSPPERGYQGQPVLKEPVWTWEVPLYFFVGGTAGAAAAVAGAARLAGADPALERAALAIAASGALLSTPLLISDLGRPGRFLNMLRVVKLGSPMSVGAWTLALFTPAALLALAARSGWADAGPLGAAAEGASALLGLVLATYTGVLLAATAIPVWNAHRRLLPAHFAASALGSAAALLELIGHLVPATQRLGIAAAAFETGVLALLELDRRRPEVDRPLHHGRSAGGIRLAGLLAGPLPLALRLAGGDLRIAAALAFLAGSLLSRYAWLAAGRASARDPAALFAPPGGARPP